MNTFTLDARSALTAKQSVLLAETVLEWGENDPRPKATSEMFHRMCHKVCSLLLSVDCATSEDITVYFVSL